MALEKVLISYDSDTAVIKQKLTDLENNLKNVETVGKKSAKGVEEGFKNTGKSIEGVDKKVNTFGKETLGKLQGIIVGAFAVDRVISFGIECVKAFREAELASTRLAFAIDKIAKEGTGSFDRLIKQSKQLEKISIFSDDDIQKAQASLVTFGLTSKEVEKLIPKILDLASINGDLAGSTDTALRAIEGQTRGLKTVGASFDDTGSKTENYNTLLEKLNKLQGQTGVAFETSAGQAKAFDNQINNLMESLGGKFAPIQQNFKVGVLGFFVMLLSKDFLDAFFFFLIAAHIAKKEIESLSKEVKNITEEKVAEKKEAEFNVTKATIAELNKRLLLVKDGTTLAEQDLTEAIKKELEKRQKDADKANDDIIKGVEERKKAVKKIFEDEQIENAVARVAAEKKAEKDDIDAFKKRNADRIAQGEIALKSFELEEKRKTDLVKQAEEDRLEIQQAGQQALVDLLTGFIDIQKAISRNRSDQEIQAIDEQSKAQLEALDIEQQKREGTYKAKTKIEKEFDAKRQAIEKEAAKRQAEIRTEQAKKDKEAALIQAAINIALAVTAGLSKPAIPPFPSAIAAGIAGAVQLALIAAQPIPKFKRGGEVGGRPHSQGGTLIEAEKGEFFTSVEQTRKYKEALMAINSNRFDDYVLTNHVTPFLKKAKAKKSQQDSEVFSNLAESLKLNGFDDYNIVRGLRPLRHVATSEDINRLIQTMSRNYR